LKIFSIFWLDITIYKKLIFYICRVANNWSLTRNIQKLNTNYPKTERNFSNTHVMSQFHHSLTISPIAKNYKKKNGQPDSRCDYNEQMERKLNGYSLMWDDTPQNSSRVGEFFGFYRYKIDVSIHMILHIADSEDRLSSWKTNIGQRNRNVLYLSNAIVTIPWSEWLEIGGAKRSMGTSNVKKNLTQINEYILRNLKIPKFIN
jgi:hypothetical protein